MNVRLLDHTLMPHIGVRLRAIATARRRPALEALPVLTVSGRSVAKTIILTVSYAKREGERSPIRLMVGNLVGEPIAQAARELLF
jgi:hypothetical protein